MTVAAGDRGRRQERGGVGQVGFDDGRPRRRPGRVRPATRRARESSTVDAHRSQGLRPSSRCAAATAAAAPRGRPRTPSVKDGGGRAAARRRTGMTRWRRSGRSRRAARPVPCTVNGSGSPVDVGAQRAQRVEHGGHRPAAGRLVTVDGDRAGRGRGQRGQEPHHGAGQPAVDRRRAGQRAGGDLPVGRRTSVIAGAQRAQGAPPSGRCPGCAAARLISDGPVACAARISARLVSDLEPGTATVARTGRSATGACHGVGERSGADGGHRPMMSHERADSVGRPAGLETRGSLAESLPGLRGRWGCRSSAPLRCGSRDCRTSMAPCKACAVAMR